jgi:hypothetical protein
MQRLANCYPSYFLTCAVSFTKSTWNLQAAAENGNHRDTEKKDLVTTESTEATGKNKNYGREARINLRDLRVLRVLRGNKSSLRLCVSVVTESTPTPNSRRRPRIRLKLAELGFQLPLQPRLFAAIEKLLT